MGTVISMLPTGCPYRCRPMNECREAFEKEISSPPYERSLGRFSEHQTWPGSYMEYEVELAWCMWQAAWNYKEKRDEAEAGLKTR